MDGWGLGANPQADAIRAAHTPFVDGLYQTAPHTTLITYGEEVGLPEGQMGNSEVGHLNLGAGRIVYQELQRINVAFKDQSIFHNPALLKSIRYAKENQKPLHLMGLVSDGGVHAHIQHLISLVDFLNTQNLPAIFIHVFTDGRDTDPKSGLGFVETLQQHLNGTQAVIASVSGRYYAMDRDKRWERVKLAYDALVLGTGQFHQDPIKAIQEAYQQNITDEFILPTVITNAEGKPLGTIQDGDAVICFNFRTDRCREITEVLTQTDFPELGMHQLKLHYTTFTEYDKSYQNVGVLFENDNLENTLGEVIAAHGLKQIRIAETEKYPHVTYFFSGGRELPFPGESRIMKSSPKVATYDLKPEMSAFELTEAILPEIQQQSADFICLNYANADMVGHTGVWEAAMKAAETVDQCVQQVATAAVNNGYTVFLTADHGNADFMKNEDGSPNTAHTLNPVPLFILSKDFKGSIQSGKLGDIAPTILKVMNLPIPPQMTGKILTDAVTP